MHQPLSPQHAAAQAAHSPAPGDAPHRWRLRLLGAVELLDVAGLPVRLPTRAVTLLLARLAMAPQQQHPREELTELLWPDADAQAGRNRLRQALSVLRTLLQAEPAEVASSSAADNSPTRPTPLDPASAAEVLVADRRAIWLAPGVLVSDVHLFNQALARSDSRAAAQHYLGELLPGHFDEWVLEERAHLAASAERALTALAAAGAGGAPAHDHRPVVVEPSDAHLPRYLTRHIGFEAEGAALAAQVLNHRLVLLRGPGGAGKTRLAVEVARSLAQRADGALGSMVQAGQAFDLVLFVPLASCSNRAQMLDTLLHTLNPSGSSGGSDNGDAAQRVARTLAGRRVLLVLDNFEQLVEAGRDDLARWLSVLPDLHLLVTSRRVLGLDGEAEQVLPALPLPPPGAGLADHAMNPSLALFVDRARAAQADFVLTEHNHALAAELVRALHGLPLAIELAAARLRSLGLKELCAMLVPGDQTPASGGLALLARSGARASDDARHASMLKVLQWSWQQLSPAEQALLSALAACDGGASLALLSQLAGLSLPDTALLADSLVAASVAYVRSDAQGASRFAVFEPMREFVFFQATPAGVAQLRARHARGVHAWALSLGASPELRELRAEWRNFLRAVASGADPAVPDAAPEQALDTVLLMRHTLEDLMPPPSMLDHLRAALGAAPGHRSAWVHAALSLYSFEAGQRDAAVHHAAAALAAPALAHDRAHVLRCVARVQMRLGVSHEQALALAEEAVTLARQHGQMFELTTALTTLSILRLRRDRDLHADLARSEQALALWRAHGPRERVTSGVLGVALSLGFLRRVPEQLVLLDEARELAQALGQERLLAYATSVRGYALADLRRFAESAGCYRQCLQMAWDNGSLRNWFYALWNLPRTLAHLRRPGPAAQLMGFAEAFYAQRFGVLGREDLPEARRTRRLVAVQLGREQAADCWRQGAGLTMAQAMQLALEETAAFGSSSPRERVETP